MLLTPKNENKTAVILIERGHFFQFSISNSTFNGIFSRQCMFKAPIHFLTLHLVYSTIFIAFQDIST